MKGNTKQKITIYTICTTTATNNTHTHMHVHFWKSHGFSTQNVMQLCTCIRADVCVCVRVVCACVVVEV